MSLLLETGIISLCMIVLSAVPVFSNRIRQYSRLFYLLGTGALAGILIFDLIPDLFEMGGPASLIGAGTVWVIYSIAHLLHLKKHRQDLHPHDLIQSHGHAHGSLNVFLISMIGHCLASGTLLVASRGFSVEINHTVFWALLAHKAYESLTVSSVFVEREPSRKRALLSVIAYALSLPIGVLITSAFRDWITPSIAMVATSLAAGTLLGCLIFDFFLPSLSQMKNRTVAFLWMATGLFFTQILLKSF